MVFVGNHNGNLGTSDNLVTDFENGFKGSGRSNLKILKTVAAEIFCYCTSGCLNGIGFRLNIGCHAGGMTAPVVEEFRHMHHIFCCIGEAENHIMILTAVKLGAEQFRTLQ